MTLHVVGAGLAGLATAVEAAARGRAVRLYEATGIAGGRCRSFFDPSLGRTIDNGNHLMLSGNRALRRFAERIGSAGELAVAPGARFDFVDRRSGRRWCLDLGRGLLPGWLFSAARRVPGTIARDYLALVRLMLAGESATVTATVGEDHLLYEPLIVPLAIAVLNTAPTEGSAALLGRVLREALVAGGRTSRPVLARRHLDAAFTGPALDWLAGRGVRPWLHYRLRGLEFARGRVSMLRFAEAGIPIGPEDAVVLSVPSWAAAELVPGLTVPTETRAILNAHFRVDGLAGGPSAPLGIVGGLAEWVFVRGDVVSTTTSAADAGMELEAGALATRLWSDAAFALGLAPDLPPWRVIKERRATIAHTPAEAARRPPAWTAWPNLFLAGDWIRGPLPATIEAAIRSGERAAELACGVEGAAPS